MSPTIVVDAENVRRSIWPNVARDELIRLCGVRAGATGDDLVVVLDGPPPHGPASAGVRVVGEAGRSADDLIVELVTSLAGPVTVATSDRGLRARLPDGVAVVGGGRFVRLLLGRPD